MPQEPKRRHSKARKRTRRAAIKLTAANLVKCANCQQITIPHQACISCGFYKGKQSTIKTHVKVTKA